jgi:membrane peptidoglycan carboxypeptidase
MAIGQGPIIMTALKLAHIYATLARPDGRVPAPRFAMGVNPATDTLQFHFDRRDVWYLEAGMRRVVAPGGTAQLSRLKDWEFIGKTGTAQNPQGPSHGWFVGMGGRPGGDMEIAVTSFIEFAQHGYIPSGYVAEAINFYLDRKYGLPFRGWATPRLLIAHGKYPDWNWQTPIADPPIPPDTRTGMAAPPDSANVAAAAPPDSARQDTATAPPVSSTTSSAAMRTSTPPRPRTR